MSGIESSHKFPEAVVAVAEQVHSMGVADFWHAAELYCRFVREGVTERDIEAYRAISEASSGKTQREMMEIAAASTFVVEKMKCALSHPDIPAVLPAAVIEWTGRMARQAAAMAAIKTDLPDSAYATVMEPWNTLFEGKQALVSEQDEVRKTEIPSAFLNMFEKDTNGPQS